MPVPPPIRTPRMATATTPPAPSPAPHKRRGTRPRSAPEQLRDVAVMVRVSSVEQAQLRAKADALRLTSAEFLRQAALARRLKPPPVAAINREQYIELARLAEDLHELAQRANGDHPVTVADALLQSLRQEVGRLRLELIGAAPLLRDTDRADASPANSSPCPP